jgi:hypothetical protein
VSNLPDGSPRETAEPRSLRVLIATAWLGDRRGGTELYALEVAAELLRRGHRPTIFSPALGTTADEARAAGVPVVDALAEIAEAPDVIHGQHQVETATALLHFPGTPAVFFCMSSRFWTDIPLRHPRVRRYVAYDLPTYERITLEAGVDPSLVDTVLNFVDLRKFRQRGPLPARPERALIFSNYASERSHVPVVRAACEARGIVLDVFGAESGRQTREPEKLLVEYDLVFAKARAAIEALAVGAAVIVCDFDGVGPLVSTANVDELRALNFGYRAQTEPHEVEAVLRQIDRFNPDDALAVSARIRATAGLDLAVDAIERAYRQAIAANIALPLDVELRAAADYLHWLNPYLREREQAFGWAERLLEIAEERSQRIEELTVELDDRRTRAEGLLATAEERGRLVEELTGELDRRTARGERLVETAEERGRLIEDLTGELDRRVEIIKELEQVIAERTAWAEGLLATAEARGAVISELDRALREQRATT